MMDKVAQALNEIYEICDTAPTDDDGDGAEGMAVKLIDALDRIRAITQREEVVIFMRDNIAD